jgi:hypothetical protein
VVAATEGEGGLAGRRSLSFAPIPRAAFRDKRIFFAELPFSSVPVSDSSCLEDMEASLPLPLAEEMLTTEELD